MKLTTSHLRKYLPALFLALHAASAEAAISIGSGGGPATTTSHEFQTDYSQWLVADLSDPIVPVPLEITTSFASGAWIQTLTFPSGFPSLSTGDIFDLQELLQFTGGDHALSSWGQQILTPGWEWVSASIFDSDTSSELAGLSVNLSADVVSFSFDPLSPGASLIVAKQIQYTGAPGAATSLSIQAIPEPAGTTLCMLGTVVLLARRRAK